MVFDQGAEHGSEIEFLKKDDTFNREHKTLNNGLKCFVKWTISLRFVLQYSRSEMHISLSVLGKCTHTYHINAKLCE